MKRRKVAGIDGIAGEVWMFSEGQIREKLREILKKVWSEEGFSEKWRVGLISPIHKKGDERCRKLQRSHLIMYSI